MAYIVLAGCGEGELVWLFFFYDHWGVLLRSVKLLCIW